MQRRSGSDSDGHASCNDSSFSKALLEGAAMEDEDDRFLLVAHGDITVS